MYFLFVRNVVQVETVLLNITQERLKKPMTKQEIIDWIGNLKPIDIPYSEYNHEGNRIEVHIYQKDGKLYKINFFEDMPTDSEVCRGWKGGFYNPEEVIKQTKMIEEVTYIEKV